MIIAKDGRIIIAIGPYCWGRGPNSQVALRNARNNFSRSLSPKGRVKVVLVDAPEEATISALDGSVQYPRDVAPPVQVGESYWVNR